MKTHPWFKFELNVEGLELRTWILLGEAVSKIEHIAGVPLVPETAERLHAIYLAKGAFATAAIEGNTLTEEEVRQHLDGALELPPSREYLGREIDNVVSACNDIGKAAIRGSDRTITVEDLLGYNKQVLAGLPLAEDVVPGRIREHSVVVGRYKAVPAQDCEYLLERLCEWLNTISLPKGLEKQFDVLLAIISHVYFVLIHPFADGNGRTARLLEFRFLLQAGFPSPVAHLLSNFYNQTRSEYYIKLDEISKTEGNVCHFIDYAIQGLVDQLKEQLKLIWVYHMDTVWENYVHQQFKKTGITTQRRRRLVLALSDIKSDRGWIDISKIASLSSQVMRDYSTKTPKTLTRDLQTLIRLRLIKIKEKKIKANKALILAFLPPRVTQHSDES